MEHFTEKVKPDHSAVKQQREKSSSYQHVGRFCNSLMLVMNPLKSCTHAGIDFILPRFVSPSLVTCFASSISGESFLTVIPVVPS